MSGTWDYRGAGCTPVDIDFTKKICAPRADNIFIVKTFLFSDNLRQKIQRLFHFLAQFVFTTSETEVDYYHQKVNVRVAERLKN